MANKKTFTVYALTTIDNPFDPIDEFENWYAFDIEKGYNTAEYLARIAKTSDFLSPESNMEEISSAIDEIIEINPFKIYKKVTKEVEV